MDAPGTCMDKSIKLETPRAQALGWSPDSRYLAFARIYQELGKIEVYDTAIKRIARTIEVIRIPP